MGIKISCITINAIHLEDILAFYTQIGMSFSQVVTSKGGAFYRAQCDGLKFEVHSIHNATVMTVPNMQLSFDIKDLHSMHAGLIKINRVSSMLEPFESDGSVRSVLIDPDGRSVELLQKP